MKNAPRTSVTVSPGRHGKEIRLEMKLGKMETFFCRISSLNSKKLDKLVL